MNSLFPFGQFEINFRVPSFITDKDEPGNINYNRKSEEGYDNEFLVLKLAKYLHVVPGNVGEEEDWEIVVGSS